MEKNCEFQMPARKVNRANLYADPEAPRPTITRLVHGTSFKFGVDLSRQHGKDRSFAEK